MHKVDIARGQGGCSWTRGTLSIDKGVVHIMSMDKGGFPMDKGLSMDTRSCPRKRE